MGKGVGVGVGGEGSEGVDASEGAVEWRRGGDRVREGKVAGG